MKNIIYNKWLIIISIILFSFIVLINDIIFYSSSEPIKANQKFLFDANIVNLGLDLQGGKEFLLAPKIESWLIGEFKNYNNIKAKKDLFEALENFKSNHSKNNLEELNIDTLAHYLQYTKNKSTISDLYNGKTIQDIKTSLKKSLESNTNIIRNRIDEKGVVEPSVRVVGSRISVEIPGKQNIDRLEEIITSSAKLEFNKMVKGMNLGPEDWNSNIIRAISKWPDLKNLTTKKTALFKDGSDLNVIYLKKSDFLKFKDLIQLKGADPWFNNYKFLYIPPENSYYKNSIINFAELFENGDKLLCIVLRKPILTGDSVNSANASTDNELMGDYIINLEFDNKKGNKNKSASEVWATFTEKNIGKIVTVSLDDNILTSPVIRTKIPDGMCQISGFETLNEAQYVAMQLRHGKLNLPLKIDYSKNSGPELGKQMIKLGIIAFIVGISFVIIFIIIFYKKSGLIASSALLLNILFMGAILSILGATLTLPGIAGFILTVGIAVDANVIIFERIKEEIQKGIPPLSAIESGYNRAFITIIDANITTLLTAFILYSLGSGPIKGFAVTLIAGIICSMFTAIYITRTIFDTIYQSKIPKKLSI
ncbi:MAG: protein translocase subunit SecD [Candidatus Marinimicrobia bacterium]|nr:protein translocase subunit SecD [Candidatus Neomarinimicrobiota bacterium]|tara:strand:+ start:4673 stop:6457 length:1785 start_codon:yes stop_codon:yes gene_type:complete